MSRQSESRFSVSAATVLSACDGLRTFAQSGDGTARQYARPLKVPHSGMRIDATQSKPG